MPASPRAASPVAQPAVIPTPSQLTIAPLSGIPVTSGTTVTCSEQALIPLAERFVHAVTSLCGIELTLDRGNRGAISVELVPGDAAFDQLSRTAGTSPAGSDPSNERYGLEATPDGVRVWSTHLEGVFRGLTSLAQLIATNRSNRPSTIPAVRIIDGPRFAWRGLSLDVARTFFGVD